MHRNGGFSGKARLDPGGRDNAIRTPGNTPQRAGWWGGAAGDPRDDRLLRCPWYTSAKYRSAFFILTIPR